MTDVTVMRDRYVRGYPAHERGEAVYTLPLAEALTRSYASDAHMVQYTSPVARRLTAEAIGQVAIELRTIVLDVDCAEVHGTDEPVPPIWREDFAEQVWALDDDHPGVYAYETRGGGRIVYEMAEPSIIATADDAAKWSREYAVVVAYLAAEYGIHADPACADWQRLFRLPHATRDKGGQPEQLRTYGDPSAIGKLWIEPRRSHVARAKLAQPRVFGRTPRAASYSYSGDGRGVLYHALAARGHVVGDHRRGHVVVCPNSAQHSTGRDGDGSTILQPPDSNQALGWITCLHAHCSGLSARDWLAMFTDTELEHARRSSGVQGVA